MYVPSPDAVRAGTSCAERAAGSNAGAVLSRSENKVERVNCASCQLFAQTQEKLIGHHATQLITGFNFQRWLDSNPQNTHSEHVVINGQNFLMEITPVYLKGENAARVLTGAVIMLRSTVRMGRQLQNLSSRTSAHSARLLR